MSLGVRHVSRRRKERRVHKGKKEPFERISVLKTALDILIYPVALAAPLAFLPQIIKIYATQSAGGLSIATWIIFSGINLVWIFYGYVHRERPIIITNIIYIMMHAALILGIVLYR